MDYYWIILWIFLAIIVLYILHHVLLWMEREGWVYYKHKRSTGASNALLAAESAFYAPKQYVIEQKQEEQKECKEEEDGENGKP